MVDECVGEFQFFERKLNKLQVKYLLDREQVVGAELAALVDGRQGDFARQVFEVLVYNIRIKESLPEEDELAEKLTVECSLFLATNNCHI